MLTIEQCKALLENISLLKHAEELAGASEYNLENLRLFKPISRDQKGKINILLSCKAGTSIDDYDLVELESKFKKLFKRKDINLAVENHLEEAIKPFIKASEKPLTAESILEIAKEIDPSISIDLNENNEEYIFSVHVKKKPGVQFNVAELKSCFWETAQSKVVTHNVISAQPAQAQVSVSNKK